MNTMVPKKVFFTRGVGVHKDELQSYEMALRKAGIEKCNMVCVSSIFPPSCKKISKKEGLKLLQPGQITFCVMARNTTNEANRLVGSAIGLAVPADKKKMYGYLSEHHGFGKNEKEISDYAEDLAASMLGSTLGIEIDPELAWSEKEEVYKASGKIFKTSSFTQTAQGDKNRKYTTVIAVAVFIL